MSMVTHLWDALHVALAMFWQILWPLILGFTLSGIVQAVVSKAEMIRMLPDDSPKTMAKACGLGAASSSCSYAAVALARSIFRKGANFTAAMVFEIASTNLVAELGIIMIVLLGWQFALAEFVGAPVMVIILVTLFRKFLSPYLLFKAREQGERGVKGRMEGHAEMNMSVTEGSILRRIFSANGITAVSHYFVTDWAAVWMDITGGLLLAGAIAAWVPKSFWTWFFVSSHPSVASVWGPLIGPVVAIVSFVCSVGNVPLAAVLWNSGISFGGVIAFIFADLIVIPILNIYRKYYGIKVMIFILTTFYASMVGGAWVIDFVFQSLGLIPGERKARVVEAAITWNYTTVLNIIFLAIAGVLLYRFFTTGGTKMLGMMNRPSHSLELQMAPDSVRNPK
jgi:uncharacterized protein